MCDDHTKCQSYLCSLITTYKRTENVIVLLVVNTNFILKMLPCYWNREHLNQCLLLNIIILLLLFFYLPLGKATTNIWWPKRKNHWPQASGHHILQAMTHKKTNLLFWTCLSWWADWLSSAWCRARIPSGSPQRVHCMAGGWQTAPQPTPTKHTRSAVTRKEGRKCFI